MSVVVSWIIEGVPMGSPKQSLNMDSYSPRTVTMSLKSQHLLRYLIRVGFQVPSDRPTELNSCCSPVRRWKVDYQTFCNLARSHFARMFRERCGVVRGWSGTVRLSTGSWPEATRKTTMYTLIAVNHCSRSELLFS